MTGGMKVIPKDSQIYKTFLETGNVEDLLEEEPLTEDDDIDTVAEEDIKQEPVSPNKMTREDQFKYYAERRVNAILKELQRLGAMSNTYLGHYDKKSVGSIFFALEKGIKSTRDMYVNVDSLNANFSFK